MFIIYYCIISDLPLAATCCNSSDLLFFTKQSNENEHQKLKSFCNTRFIVSDVTNHHIIAVYTVAPNISHDIPIIYPLVN